MRNEKIDFYSSTNLKSYNLDDTMKYQLSMLERLDVFTKRHSENVANLVCRICEYLHCKKFFTIHATICGYLHDIGKLFIPPEILNKPGSLTDEEYEVIKTHTTLGYEMCMKDIKLRPYADGPLYHHEALNGTGYPRGLSKKDIPYEGQIIRVADEYDAIVSKRQYKSHIGISDTLKILIENSKPIKSSDALGEVVKNSKFGKNNPAIVRVLIKVVLDDVKYEIYCTETYVEYLLANINRFKIIDKYYNKMIKCKDAKKKKKYEQAMMSYFRDNETLGNFQKVKEDYQTAYKTRKEKIDNLYNEVNIIKKLKV